MLFQRSYCLYYSRLRHSDFCYGFANSSSQFPSFYLYKNYLYFLCQLRASTQGVFSVIFIHLTLGPSSSSGLKNSCIYALKAENNRITYPWDPNEPTYYWQQLTNRPTLARQNIICHENFSQQNIICHENFKKKYSDRNGTALGQRCQPVHKSRQPSRVWGSNPVPYRLKWSIQSINSTQQDCLMMLLVLIRGFYKNKKLIF